MSKTQTMWMTALWGVVVAMMVGVVASRSSTRSEPRDQPAATPPAQQSGVNASQSDNALPAAENLHSRSPQAAKLEPLFPAPEFSLTDQSGKTITNKDLIGKVWVADFIFTRCGGPCPRMTATMSQLADAVPESNVRFVSFSVDPEHDTPEVLSEYAKRFSADGSRWKFLTGPKGALFDAARGMRLSVTEATADEPITHSAKFLVVDGKGQIVGIYNSGTEADVKQLVTDLHDLARKSS